MDDIKVGDKVLDKISKSIFVVYSIETRVNLYAYDKYYSVAWLGGRKQMSTSYTEDEFIGRFIAFKNNELMNILYG